MLSTNKHKLFIVLLSKYIKSLSQYNLWNPKKLPNRNHLQQQLFDKNIVQFWNFILRLAYSCLLTKVTQALSLLLILVHQTFSFFCIIFWCYLRQIWLFYDSILDNLLRFPFVLHLFLHFLFKYVLCQNFFGQIN